MGGLQGEMADRSPHKWEDEAFTISWQAFKTFATVSGLSPQNISPFELKSLFESFADGGETNYVDANSMSLQGALFIECILQCIRDISDDWKVVVVKLEEMLKKFP